MNFFAVNTESRYVETVPTPITFEKVVLGENAFKVNKCRDTITAQAEGDAFITINVVWESGRLSMYMQYYATLNGKPVFGSAGQTSTSVEGEYLTRSKSFAIPDLKRGDKIQVLVVTTEPNVDYLETVAVPAPRADKKEECAVRPNIDIGGSTITILLQPSSAALVEKKCDSPSSSSSSSFSSSERKDRRKHKSAY